MDKEYIKTAMGYFNYGSRPSVSKPKEWVIDARRDPCECSQKLPLTPTGYSDEQCPSKYCPVCKVGFWYVKFEPTFPQVEEAKKKYNNTKITQKDLTYYAYRKVPNGRYGTSPENVMIDQLGGKLPDFLSKRKKEYWREKYMDKYPNSTKTIKWKKMKKEGLI